MTEHRRNILVGAFVLIGIICVGWMLWQFRDLPVRINRYRANVITTYFDKAPGVEANTAVYFLGYSVGRVVAVDPPAAVEIPGRGRTYQIRVEVAINKDREIPANIIPKVFQKGLGSSYLELILPPGEPASAELLADGATLQGEVSSGSEFISEETQKRLDGLIVSLTRLGDTLQGQFITTPPDAVDNAAPDKPVYPNLTTAIMRLDSALKNLNSILGDAENQAHLKHTLEGFAKFTDDLQDAVADTRQFMTDARALVQKADGTLDTAEGSIEKLRDTYDATGRKIQSAADAVAGSLKEFRDTLALLNSSKGTAGKILNDPRLYEALTDSAQTLKLTLAEFRQLIADLEEHGIVGFKGQKKD